MRRAWLTAAALSFIVAILSLYAAPLTVNATKYGAGSYGRCQYQTCSITMSSSSTVSVNVVPTSGSARCSIASDTVTVTTSSSTGYNLKLADADTSTVMTSGSNAISAGSGTFASPAVLAANSWGYRIDSAGTFGAGPTSANSNVAIPPLTFAAIQPSSGTADTIITTSTAASSGSATSVWYGLCINTTVPSGTYSDSVVYTALTN